MNFKKIFITFLCCFLFLTGCSNESTDNETSGNHYYCPSPSQKAVDIGEKALSITKNYLLGNKDQIEAYDELSDLCDNELNYVEKYTYEDRQENNTYYSDFNIRTAIAELTLSVISDDDSPESYDEIIADYNWLADFLDAPNW